MAITTPAPQPTPRTTVVSPHAQLDALVVLATGQLNEQLMPMITRLVGVMLDITDPALDAHSVYHRVKSGNLLKNNAYAYFHLACTEIERSLRKEIALLAPPRKKASAAAAALTLVPLADMDRSVAFGGISRPFEAACAEQLATLNVRLGYLLGRDTLRIGQNPFRPDLILMGLHQAWTEFEPDAEAHALLAPLLRPAVLFDFAPVYEALNQSLMDGGGQADALRIRKTDNAARAKAQRATGQAALAEQLRQFFSGTDASLADESGIPLIPDLPSMPSGAGGWRPSGAEAFRGAIAAQPAAEPGAAGPKLASTHDGRAPQVAQFPGAPGQAGVAQFLGAPGQPGAAYPGFAMQPGAHHGAQQALQLPSGDSHPGLLEMLAKLQLHVPEQAGGSRGVHGPAAAGAPGNVFYLPRLKESLPKGSLTRGDESTIDLLTRIFETVYVDENIPQETRELIQYLQAPVLKAALQDKNFFFQDAHPARRMIDLMSRMGWEQRHGADDPLFQAMQRGVDRVGRDFDAEVGVFADAVAELEASIAAEDSVAAAEISAPIAAALKQEKVTAANKSAKTAVAMRVGTGDVVAVVETFLEKKWTSVLTIAYSVEPDKPGAVGSATRTMDDLIWSVKPKITQEQRKQLIGKLPGLLATLNKWLDIIKWQDAERLQFFAELAECHASIVRAPIELSPERQVEIAIEVAQQDAQRRLEKEQALAAAEQAEAQQAEADPAVVTVDGLERGMWLEFTQPDGSAQTVKLAWISPLRTLFIFSTGARKEAFSLTVEKLAEAYRDDTVRMVRQDGVVARALAEAMGPAVNDVNVAATA
ncbi:hypothetical protein CR105_07275 [Massilia eurypsychrophila]|uniref:Thymidine phosphorylase n=1 Tax=Massilia eurypsychrophila TaxID=1485217 RepID=A0A2G8TIS5_9BURK|nr:hypothetical protein CR105_07275 [Massilia eurypsychrophila]